MTLKICFLQETHLRKKDLHRLKVKGWNKYSKQMDKKKSQGSNTYVRQNRLQNKDHKRDTDGHFIILKGSIHHEDINIVNLYASNIGANK